MQQQEMTRKRLSFRHPAGRSWLLVGGTIAALLLLLVATFTCRPREVETLAPVPRDYAEIAREGVLRATMEYNSVSFFMDEDTLSGFNYVDEDTLSGFNYALIHAFARDHGLQVDIMPEMAFDKCLRGLADGTYDVIANGILATSELKDSLLLTTPIVLSRQVLVQRKAASDEDTLFIKSLLNLGGNLGGKTVYVPKDSPYILRLRNLGDEIGDTIYINEVERYGAEQLMAMVAHGDIDYAVCEESVAHAVADSLPQLDISTAIGFTQFYSWAVSKQSPALLDTLNVWIAQFKEGKEYEQICREYDIN